MTEHEDLIARLRNCSGVQTADVNERVALMDEAADALEKVTVERDNWKLSAEEAERAEKRAEKRAEGAEARIERAEDYVTRHYLDTTVGERILAALTEGDER